MAAQERIADVGYINDQKQHAVISIFNPVILNSEDGWVQVVISINAAIALRAELDTFLSTHYTQIVVEDGTGINGANSYLSEAEAEDFWGAAKVK